MLRNNSLKNFGLSPAASDLGLGDMLREQVDGETEDERKRRLAQMQQSGLGTRTGGAVMDLLGGMRNGFGSL